MANVLFFSKPFVGWSSICCTSSTRMTMVCRCSSNGSICSCSNGRLCKCSSSNNKSSHQLPHGVWRFQYLHHQQKAHPLHQILSQVQMDLHQLGQLQHHQLHQLRQMVQMDLRQLGQLQHHQLHQLRQMDLHQLGHQLHQLRHMQQHQLHQLVQLDQVTHGWDNAGYVAKTATGVRMPASILIARLLDMYIFQMFR